jgi:hypothetical protein
MPNISPLDTQEADTASARSMTDIIRDDLTVMPLQLAID